MWLFQIRSFSLPQADIVLVTVVRKHIWCRLRYYFRPDEFPVGMQDAASTMRGEWRVKSLMAVAEVFIDCSVFASVSALIISAPALIRLLTTEYSIMTTDLSVSYFYHPGP
ncbi:hypothetical protein BaRGS_00015354 [Batillaria attramentaria]|uniref:Uncharacterized protein n=1 Tax=Batillaria attramentaria TaxID=370345 RepID=A0ABD0L1S0_9CAEN